MNADRSKSGNKNDEIGRGSDESDEESLNDDSEQSSSESINARNGKDIARQRKSRQSKSGNRCPISQFPIEKVQKKGIRGLSLTPSYCEMTGWGIQQGLRELFQNLYNPLLFLALNVINVLNRFDNVTEYPDGTGRSVEWIFEETEDGLVHSYIAYEKGTRPKPNRKTGLHNRSKALAFIIHRINEKRLVLVNRHTILSRWIWALGQTSKTNKPHQIGGHGIFPVFN